MLPRWCVLFVGLIILACPALGIPFQPTEPNENREKLEERQDVHETGGIFWQNFSLPVVKRGTVGNTSITFSSNSTPIPENPILYVGGKKIWEFGGEFGKYQNFTTPLTVDFSTNSSYQTEILVPHGRVNSAAISVASNVTQLNYDFQFYTGNRKVWERNTSSQIFVDGRTIATSNLDLYGTEAEDLNNDGKMDMIVLDRSGNMLVLENGGDTNFTPHHVPVLDYQDHPAKKAMFRRGSSGYVDIYFQFSDCILAVKNYGNFTFSRAISVASPGDGVSDFIVNETNLFVSKNTGLVYVYNFTGDAVSFSHSFQGAGDSVDAIALSNGELIWGAADGCLYFENGTSISVSSFPLSALAVLQNNRILAGDTNGTLYMITPSLGVSQIIQKPWKKINRIVSSDLNGDGIEDIGFSTMTGSFYVLLGKGTDYEEVFSGAGYWCTFADVDSDGTDAVAASSQKVYLYRNNRNVFIENVNLTGALNECLDSSTPLTDSWGNRFVKLNLTFYGIPPAKLTVSMLSIDYNYTVTLPITDRVTEYVGVTAPNETGFVNVPVCFSSTQEFAVLPVLKLNYVKCPPFLKKLIPDLAFDEDSFPVSGINLLDLSEIFGDERDKVLSYRIVYMEKPEILKAEISGNFMSFYPAENWYGRAMFCVAASDSENQETRSNYFNVTVMEVNDPPTICQIPPVRVNKDADYYLNLTDKINDVDSREFMLSTDSEHVEVLNQNLSLRLRFPDIGNYTVNLSVSDGIAATNTSFDVEVLPYGFPLWKPLPVIYTQKNRNISSSAGVNLLDYVIDVDTPAQNLKFRVVSQTNRDINVSVIGTRVQVNITYNYVGRGNVTLAVNDGVFENYANLMVIVNETNYPPVYLGGLEPAYIVYEDTQLVLDLAKHFFDVEDGAALTYGCTNSAVVINGSIALYMPRHGSANLSVQFFALDSAGQNAFSPLINLTFVEVNDPPVYLGGLNNITLLVNQTMTIELDKYFWDEEASLSFGVSNPSVKIKNNTAEFSFEGPASFMFNFSASDGEYTVYSQNLTLTVLPLNQRPVAKIERISHYKAYTNTEIEFRGSGTDVDGNITAYLWVSSIDGVLSTESNFTKKLSKGQHIIKFRVQDNNETWSEDVEKVIVVEDPPVIVNPVVGYLPTAGISALVLGLVFNISGRILMKRRTL
ncbi:MAG: VCBS repeat-containing protein [Thermoplasmata archaeon]|nr:VCBS repeat-containing protein [Thermoplasmata archaeon]